MKSGTTVYLYELAWILPSIAIPVGMLVALVVTAFGVGIHLPGDAGRIDVTRVAETPPFEASRSTVWGHLKRSTPTDFRPADTVSSC